ncbi:hypothetical protein CEQ90_13725 [Lewinellaceae bacterium SD302]|nr:hypothetical protein CEQ90_13725 [Lewinellaceae bacterium SD302]
MKPYVLNFLFLLLFLLSACNEDDDGGITSPPSSPVTTEAELRTALTDIQADAHVPGFAINVIHNGSLVFQEAFGEADLSEGRAFTNQTRIPIGSVSKTFVAAAVTRAMEQGLFTLDTKVNDLLEQPILHPELGDTEITIGHLLTHTSGLLDDNDYYFPGYHLLPGGDNGSEGSRILTDLMGMSVRTPTPLPEYLAEYYYPDGDGYRPGNFSTSSPGTDWAYSNIATSLAAYLVEAASGVDYAEYVRSEVLLPLGMNSTAFPDGVTEPENLATLYWDEETPFPAYANDGYPDGGLVTNNEDLALYMIDLVKGVSDQGGVLFETAAYQTLFTPRLEIDMLPESLGENQGVNWFLADSEAYHTGADPGVVSRVQLGLENGYALSILANIDPSTDDHASAWLEVEARIITVIAQFLEAR